VYRRGTMDGSGWQSENLRQHLARLGRKSLSFSKSVELHDKVIGHYLNIKHYQ
ncbi:IS1 family transposase, partial [Shigella sonnei]|uniref:IS1 family transposase n=1 Tax=Shigella sonnei TaxID=624 RepID=UPI001C0A6A92